MPNKITAYEGPENYVFISYAHKDTDLVFPILEELRCRGYRIWYDDGIAPGSEWPEDIAQHLNNSAMAIAFVSPNSMASVNCRREINFALSKQKPFLSIILQPTEMPLGMELQLSAQQSVIRHNYRSESQFIEKICSCPDLACCREPAAEHAAALSEVQPAAPAGASEKSQTPPAAVSSKETAEKSDPVKRQPPKKSGMVLGIAAGAVALLILALVFFFTSFKPDAGDPSSSSETTAPNPAETTSAPVAEYTVHVQVPRSWANAGLWAWSESDGREAFDAWPGLAMEPDADGWYTGSVPSWANCVSISGNGGEYESQRVVLDGREVWIVVREDWSCQLSYDGPFTGTVTVYASLPDDWSDPYCWAWSGSTDIFVQWPGEAFITDGDWCTIVLPNYTTGINISANNSGVETGDVCFEPGWDVWVVVADGRWTYFYEEPTEEDIRSAFGS